MCIFQNGNEYVVVKVTRAVHVTDSVIEHDNKEKWL